MVSAWIVEVFSDDTKVARGLYGFVQLPTMGDRLALPNDSGKLDVLGVVQIAHSPARIQPDAQPDKEPLATVFVQWVAEEDVK
jgi:hypothetical protein